MKFSAVSHSLSIILLTTTALFATAVPGALAQDATVLERLEVEAESDDILVQDGYVAESGRIGSKIDTPLIEVPQAVSTVTEKQLDEQNPRTLNEALNYVPGVRTTAFGFDPRFDSFFIRGFDATCSGIFRDGLRQFNSPTGLFRQEPYGLEGITVLKGPASALYGASSAGGLVDLMTKRPKSETFREIEVQGGSHDRYQMNFDFSGSVDENETLLYRMTGLLRDAGTTLPGFPDDRVYLAPALTWQPSVDTKLTLLGEYMDSTVGGTAAFYNDANGITDIYEGDPSFNDFGQQQARIGYEFEHSFNETFTFRQNLRYTWLENDLEYANHYVVEEPDSLFHGAGRNAEDARTLVIDNQLLSEFYTGPVEHRLLVGLDYGRISYDQYGNYGSYDQDGNFIPNPIPEEGDTLDISFLSAQTLNQVGLYASDQVNYNNWHLTLGGRYDWLDGETTTAADVIDQKDEQFSWRVGLSYETPWGVVPYANYTTSFTPNVGTLVDGSPANPTVGEQKEIGVKYKLPGYNAVITAALFDIQQEDGVVFEVIEGMNEQVNRDLHAQGFEIEANASLDNGLSLIASYAYVDMKIENSKAGLTGNQLNSVPQHTFSIWGDYAFLSGPLEGLGIGAGVRYVGKSYGDDANTVLNDDRYYVDASVSYDFGARFVQMEGVRLQVNATNLLNEEGVTCSANYCYRDEGRSVIASMRYRF